MNLRSNRLWIVWGGALYLRSNTLRHLPTPGQFLFKESWLAQVHIYKRPKRFFSRSKISDQEIGVLILELGRFGNMVRRLANALEASQLLGVKELIVPRDVVFHQEIFEKSVYDLGHSQRIWFGAQPRSHDNPIDVIIAEDFFSNVSKKTPESTGRASQTWSQLRLMLRGLAPKRDHRDGWLTIHLRSGDVFGSRSVPGYGQPPLSFYQLVIASTEWRGITLVYQDTSNPVVLELKNHCQSLGMRVELQSGTIREDLRVLLGAKTLVAGRGTFIPGVAGLSSECEKVFFFEDKCNLVPRRSGIELVRVYDREGTYRDAILSNNWNNTSDQRELMLSYPMSSLAIEGS